MKPPRWSNDEAVAEWIWKVIDDAYVAEREVYLARRRDEPPRAWAMPTTAEMEQSAIKSAERGNFKSLGRFIEKNPDWVLSQKARALIAAKLKGTLKRGRPKQPRWRRNPMRDAAEYVEEIDAILREHYPKEKGIKARAIDIAAAQAKVSRQKLESYCLKSRHYRAWKASYLSSRN